MGKRGLGVILLCGLWHGVQGWAGATSVAGDSRYLGLIWELEEGLAVICLWMTRSGVSSHVPLPAGSDDIWILAKQLEGNEA